MQQATLPRTPSLYAELKARIDALHLFERSKAYYAWKIALTLTLWAIGATVFVIARHHPVILLIDAAYLAFVYGQVGLLGHDAGHRQITKTTFANMLVSHTCSFFVGISSSSWAVKHNMHHLHPNTHDSDPDISFPMLAFDERQVEENSKGFAKFFIQRQHWILFLLLPLVSISLRMSALHYIVTNSFKKIWLDAVLYFAHFVLYFGAVFWLLPLPLAIAFLAVHQLAFGLYMGMVFAPNHKGMEMFEKDSGIDFVREQVLSSRNIRAHAVIDFLYGGLNFQIEHHLFPNMPRCNLRKAQKLVKEFCREKYISYHETGLFGSMKEIYDHMREMSMYARRLDVKNAA